MGLFSGPMTIDGMIECGTDDRRGIFRGILRVDPIPGSSGRSEDGKIPLDQ